MLANANVTIPLDLTTVLAAVGVISGMFMLLIKIIRNSDEKRWGNMEKQLGELPRLQGKVSIIEEKAQKFGRVFDKVIEIEVYMKRMEVLDHTSASLSDAINSLKDELSKVKEQGAVSVKVIERLEWDLCAIGKTVEKMREDLADARETLVGFGKDFLTRKEYREDRRERSETNAHTLETRILSREGSFRDGQTDHDSGS